MGPSLFFFALLVGLSGITTSCSKAKIGAFRYLKETESALWNEPVSLDLHSLYPEALASSATCSRTVTALSGAPAISTSFAEYRFASGPESAGLLFTGCTTGNRVVSRLYDGVTGGWSSLPGSGQALDAGGSADIFLDLTLAFSAAGEFFATFWNANSLTIPRSATWTAESGWNDFKTGSFAAATTTAVGSNNTATLGDFDGTVDLINGHLSSSASSRAGWSVAAYPTTSATSPLALIGYTQADFWGVSVNKTMNPPVMKTNATVSTAKIRQSLVLDDGLGLTVLWSSRITNNGNTQICHEIRSSWITEVPGSTFWTDAEAATRSVSCPAAGAATGGLDSNDCSTVAACEAPMMVQSPVPTVGDFDGDDVAAPFAAATDGQGTVVSVFYASDPAFNSGTGTVTCSSSAPRCSIRLYASARGASGEWTAPSQIDENLFSVRTTTTYFQNPLTAANAISAVTDTAGTGVGGMALATPGLAYIGGGEFLLVSAVIDVTTSSAPRTRMFSRKYKVGVGWDATPQIKEILDSALGASTSSFYRIIQDMKLVSDGAGNALLFSPFVTGRGGLSDTAMNEPRKRAVVPSVWRYSAGSGWESQPEFFLPEIVPPCPLTASTSSAVPTACNTVKYDGALFSNGRAVFVFPAPPSSTSTRLQLWSSEYVP